MDLCSNVISKRSEKSFPQPSRFLATLRNDKLNEKDFRKCESYLITVPQQYNLARFLFQVQRTQKQSATHRDFPLIPSPQSLVTPSSIPALSNTPPRGNSKPRDDHPPG